jgi:hypothetical protein
MGEASMSDMAEDITAKRNWRAARRGVLLKLAVLAAVSQLVVMVVVGHVPANYPNMGRYLGSQVGSAIAFFLFGFVGFLITRCIRYRSGVADAGLITGAIFTVVSAYAAIQGMLND